MTRALTPEPWMDDAHCTQSDPDEWFPDKGESNRRAKAICVECPVRALCLAKAMSIHPPPDGVWGGLSERERRKLATAARRDAA